MSGEILQPNTALGELSRDEKQLAGLQASKHELSQLREAAALLLQPNELRTQLFFATANSRLANLFARKFDFLGNGFQEIQLERSS